MPTLEQRREHVREYVRRVRAATDQKTIRALYREAFERRLLSLEIDPNGRTVEMLLFERRDPMEPPPREMLSARTSG